MTKKKEEKVTLFAAISKEQYDLLRYVALMENESLAAVTREALDLFIESKKDAIKKHAGEIKTALAGAR